MNNLTKGVIILVLLFVGLLGLGTYMVFGSNFLSETQYLKNALSSRFNAPELRNVGSLDSYNVQSSSPLLERAPDLNEIKNNLLTNPVIVNQVQYNEQEGYFRLSEDQLNSLVEQAINSQDLNGLGLNSAKVDLQNSKAFAQLYLSDGSRVNVTVQEDETKILEVTKIDIDDDSFFADIKSTVITNLVNELLSQALNEYAKNFRDIDLTNDNVILYINNQ